MSNRPNEHWYSDGKRLIGKLDRWVSGRNPQTAVEQESDWLGWDAWVRTEIAFGRHTIRRMSHDNVNGSADR